MESYREVRARESSIRARILQIYPLGLGVLGCVCAVVSGFLPWWRSVEFLSTHEVLATQDLYLLPAQFVIESSRFVVFRQVPVTSMVPALCVVLILGGLNVGLVGSVLIHRSMVRRHEGLLLYIAGILVLGSVGLFYSTILTELWPWFPTITAPQAHYLLPYGRQTSWGVSTGFYLAIVASLVFLVSGRLCTQRPRALARYDESLNSY
jgi:hypothetical protein